MTFLNPLVLFGLAAAAIPVILHLLNLRKLRTIEFSTLTFLKELQQSKIRRLKLRQLLLLIIRTLLVTLIVLAFARPALRGTILGSIGSHAHSTVVFIVDDSFSESASDEHGQRFKQVKDAALRLVDLLKEGDEVFLVKLSDLPKATIEPALHDFSTLRTAINESEISYIRHPMEDALRVAARLLTQSSNVNKEVYIISDMQRTLFLDHSEYENEQTTSLFGSQVKFFIVPIGSKNIPNASLDSVEVTTRIFEKGKPVVLKAWVRNFDDKPLHDDLVSVYLDGARAAQRSVSIEATSSASLEFSVIPRRTGYIKGYIQLESDNLEQDNRRYFAIHIPEHINVAFVSTSPSDIQYLLLALHAGNIDTAQSFMHIVQTTSQKFPLLDLKNVDVLCCSNVPSFGKNDAARVMSFLERGGGLIIFPGDNMQISEYNVGLLAGLQIPPIQGIAKSPNRTTGYSFSKIDVDHPILATMFDDEHLKRTQSNENIESPLIATTLQRQAGKQGHAIISLNDGTTFLSEHRFGEGKILFFSIAPTLTWSDFPLKTLFAPLIYRSVVYTASQGETQSSYITGDEAHVIVSRSPTAGDHHFSIVAPDGIEELIQPVSQRSAQRTFGSSLMFQPKRFTLPGFYALNSGSTTLALIAVNTDSRESDTRKVSDEQLTAFWKRLNILPSSVTSVDQADQLQSAILQSRFGVELWRYCIGGAILFALLEMLVARDSRKATQQVLE